MSWGSSVRTIGFVLEFLRHQATATGAGLVASLAVGVWVAVAQVSDGDEIDAGLEWWLPYGIFLLTFVYDALTYRRHQWLGGRPLVWAEAVAASLTYLAAPEFGWTGVLMVVSAASAAYVLSPAALTALVVGQTIVAGLGQYMNQGSVADTGLAIVAYGAFQAFAVLVVRGERRQAEARNAIAAANVDLRATSAMLAKSTQLAERLRIARELHDLVGHQLTALSIELEVASHHSDSEANRHVDRARDIADALLTDVREVVGDLRGADSGMSEPLHAIVDGLTGVEVDLRVVEDVPAGEETAMAVIRCVQEVVTNVLRHSDAETLAIVVRSGPEGVTVDAEDDGKGVDHVVEGHGLTGMRERVEGLGGKLEVFGRSRRGFRIEAKIPQQ